MIVRRGTVPGTVRASITALVVRACHAALLRLMEGQDLFTGAELFSCRSARAAFDQISLLSPVLTELSVIF